MRAGVKTNFSVPFQFSNLSPCPYSTRPPIASARDVVGKADVALAVLLLAVTLLILAVIFGWVVTKVDRST
jgi:hypothetical protein